MEAPYLGVAFLSGFRRFAATPARRHHRLIAASGLFDESFYLINGADVMAAGADPIQHFHHHGWRENRRPNLFFDPRWYCIRYLASHPDEDPLVHYIEEGESAGHRPSPYFDPSWYATAHGLKRGASPLAHYLQHRRRQQVAPNPHFDLAFYLKRHGAEIGPGRDPFMHHVRNGAALRDLNPSDAFDAARYRCEVMTGDTRTWTGLMRHEMRVPLIHYLSSVSPSEDA